MPRHSCSTGSANDRTIFSDQMALLGPPSDPVGVRGLEDLGEAFARIAGTRSKFVLNDIDGVHYLTEIEIRGSPASAAVGAGGAGADRRAIAQVEATTWKS